MLDQLTCARKSLCRWAGNHKTLLVSTGVVVACGAGAYYGVKRVIREAETMMLDSQRELVAHQRLQMHLGRSQEEIKAAFLRFVPSLKTRLYKLLDLEGIVANLKVLDKSEREMRDSMWEDAKLLGFGRLFAGLHAFCQLHLLVHCELLILGRETFHKHKGEDDTSGASVDVQQQFLSSTLEYFFETGLPKLTAEIESRLGNHPTLQTWRVKEKAQVDKADLDHLLRELHATCLPSSANDHVLWHSFLIYPDDVPEAHPAGVLPLLNELWDILETPFFKDALRASIDCLFELLATDIVAALYPHEAGPITEMSAIQRPPLAKVIPQLKVEVGRLYVATAKQSTLLQHWETLSGLETLQCLSESIFVQEADDAASRPESSWGWI
ncbi:hypothetical protein SDRG_06533 [Saprolegnia diclina VS20]|uniref:Peroxisomal assembly protein PEX3 n=1 Tax=Saprolegnia diclina (strain VS20) TaxID=1156394 RepID=T0QD00_SAPDV|nr:hypothetical protein SDRG_06533 [Saprolegnia diclina VS20]EQC35774.1 hypothetical protein SDRG_06533 [Saprolegnia diclina VS20]|eukprot:XP_008610536.1 hypothetical protein SDRG_06533 [Saprolegnia diclina VS20]